MSRLYALYDFELNQKKEKSLKEFINVCYDLDAKVIQYRDKVNPQSIKKEILLELRELWDRTLLVNDSVELASFCDGVHLGQEDLLSYKSMKKVREQIGKKIVGLSTHNKQEILETNSLDIDYIGLGAYRDTTTKKDIQGVLGSTIKELALLSCHKVAIIGGVRVDDDIEFAEFKVVGSDLYR